MLPVLQSSNASRRAPIPNFSRSRRTTIYIPIKHSKMSSDEDISMEDARTIQFSAKGKGKEIDRSEYDDENKENT